MMLVGFLLWAEKNQKLLIIGVAILALLVALQGCYWKGRVDSNHKWVEKFADAETRSQKLLAQASEALAKQRAIDDIQNNANANSRKEADDAVPDSSPSLARLALSCERMRLQGANLAKTSGCERFAEAPQAVAHH